MARATSAATTSVARTTHPEPKPAAGSSPPAKRLFGALAATDAAHAVVRRVRAAIALGLLSDGDRLPREADLAAEMGVTSFSLREALGVLREQGLLVTRPGKNGGSFVQHPAASLDLAADELVELSPAELRDLGDWRQMLVERAAALAAARASESHLVRLIEFARRVAEADNASAARRAHGRYHLELASAAQSPRMSRAEFTLHEEIGWLFELALQTPQQRSIAAEGLRSIVDAVRARDPKAARITAGRYNAGLIDRLARLRLEIIAVHEHANGHTAHDRAGTELADQVASMATLMADSLSALAERATPLLVADVTQPERRAQMAGEILRVLESFPSCTHGVGVMAEIGVVPEHPYWMSWWLRTNSGPREETGHVMDPAREDFYDYELREYMDGPRRHRRVWASGPYVDYGGLNDYIITVSAPAVHDGAFVGVAAADIPISDLERYLAPGLAALADVCLLVNSENRVIVSNSVSHHIGDVVTPRPDDVRTEIPTFDWTLIISPGPTTPITVTADPLHTAGT